MAGAFFFKCDFEIVQLGQGKIFSALHVSLISSIYVLSLKSWCSSVLKLWFGLFLIDLAIVQLGQSTNKLKPCTSSQGHLSMFQVSSFDLKGCGSYDPDKNWMKKKKKKSICLSYFCIQSETLISYDKHFYLHFWKVTLRRSLIAVV